MRRVAFRLWLVLAAVYVLLSLSQGGMEEARQLARAIREPSCLNPTEIKGETWCDYVPGEKPPMDLAADLATRTLGPPVAILVLGRAIAWAFAPPGPAAGRTGHNDNAKAPSSRE